MTLAIALLSGSLLLGAFAWALWERSCRQRAERVAATAAAAVREQAASEEARREATLAREAATWTRIQADAEAQARHDAAAARDPVEESNELLARLRRPH